MRLSAATADPPTGYVKDWNKEIWNVGYIFKWSTPRNQWLRCSEDITIKPHETIAEAFKRAYDMSIFPDYNVFFVEEK